MAKLKEKEKEPLEVKIVHEQRKNPHHGKFPYWNEVDKRPKKRFVFSNLQQPGCVLEATPGITIIKNDGTLGNHHETYKIEDGEEVELPLDIVERWKKLTYLEDGRQRPRFSFDEA